MFARCLCFERALIVDVWLNLESARSGGGFVVSCDSKRVERHEEVFAGKKFLRLFDAPRSVFVCLPTSRNLLQNNKLTATQIVQGLFNAFHLLAQAGQSATDFFNNICRGFADEFFVAQFFFMP